MLLRVSVVDWMQKSTLTITGMSSFTSSLKLEHCFFSRSISHFATFFFCVIVSCHPKFWAITSWSSKKKHVALFKQNDFVNTGNEIQ